MHALCLPAACVVVAAVCVLGQVCSQACLSAYERINECRRLIIIASVVVWQEGGDLLNAVYLRGAAYSGYFDQVSTWS